MPQVPETEHLPKQTFSDDLICSPKDYTLSQPLVIQSGDDMSMYFEALNPPSAADCTYLRTVSGLSLAEMAAAVNLAERQSWWRFEAGLRQCGLPMWELALLKTNQHPTHRLAPR